tara:strand:+ start:646 stop:2487 length:1842 start_codon:yes stop_codon:yes gene_type:complete
MFKQNNPLAMQRELTGVSRALGASKVRTTFEGTGAHATSNTINVPAMKLDAELDDYQMRIMRGYHIHEVGHIKHTDDAVWQSRCQGISEEQRDVFNCMEDILVERKINNKFAGAKRNLQETINSVLEIENAETNCMHDPIEKELGYAILQLARQAMGYKSDALEEYIKTLPEDLFTEATKFVNDAMTTEITHDTWALTERVWKAMKQAKKNTNNRKQKAQAQKPSKPCNDGGQKLPGTEQPDEKQLKMSTPTSSQGDEDGQEKQEGKQAGGKGKGKGAIDPEKKMDREKGNGQGKGDGGYGHLDISTLLEDVLSEHINQDADGREDVDNEDDIRETYMCASRDVDDGYRAHLSSENEHRWYYDGRIKLDMEKLGGDIRTNCQKVARLLVAESNDYWEGSKSEGRLDRRRLSGVVAGDRNVWRKLHREESKSVGISVMMDTSGSMDFDSARRGLLVFNECLYRTSVKYRFVWWQSCNYTYVCKKEDERGNTDHVKRKIALTGDWSGGTTPISAILPELYHLQNMDVDRRIMFFCTDGGFHRQEYKYIKFYNKMAKDIVGTEVYGVFLDCDISRYPEDKIKCDETFPDGWIQVSSRDFAKSMLEGLSSILLGAKK